MTEDQTKEIKNFGGFCIVKGISEGMHDQLDRLAKVAGAIDDDELFIKILKLAQAYNDMAEHANVRMSALASKLKVDK